MSKLREQLDVIINGVDTPAGRGFDVAILFMIIGSIAAVALESVESIKLGSETLFSIIEWTFTILFSIEYLTRIWIIKRPTQYIFSFFGIIDLLSIIPTFLSVFFVGSHSLLVIRAVRLLRIFRVLKLIRFLGEADVLTAGLKKSLPKIIVFLGGVVSISLVVGTVIYLIEGPENGFTSIPLSVYWAIVTMTTVGYGDMVPQTVLGKFFSSFLMIMGYGIIAVPAGIISSEMTNIGKPNVNREVCNQCGLVITQADSVFCHHCGVKIGDNYSCENNEL